MELQQPPATGIQQSEGNGRTISCKLDQCHAADALAPYITMSSAAINEKLSKMYVAIYILPKKINQVKG